MNIEVYGSSFSCIEDFCRYYDIGRKFVRSCLFEDLTFKGIVDRVYYINIYGLRFKSILSVSEYFNIDCNTLNVRKNRGMDLKEALIAYPKNLVDCSYEKDVIVYEGKTFGSFQELASYYDVPYVLFVLEVNRSGSVGSARRFRGRAYRTGVIRKERSPRKCFVTYYRGRTYLSLKALCNEWGYNYSHVYRGMSMGLSLDEALARSEENGKFKKISVFGEEFPSMNSAYKKYGVSAYDVRYRCRKGMSVEEAILDIQDKKARSII